MKRRVCGAAALLAFSAGAALAQDGTSVLTLLDTSERRIVPGQIVPGQLTSHDYLAAGRRVQAWAVEGQPGQALLIDLLSDEFDTYLFVAGPGVGELVDDDGGQGTNSRLCFVPAEPGIYRVVASSFGGDVGGFRLRTEHRDGCEDARDAAALTDLTGLDAGGRTVPAEGESEGVLTSADPTLFGAPVQAWDLDGRAGQTLTVDLLSPDFDAYLTVLGPGLAEWLTNDDGAGGCDSRVSVTFPESGTFTVVASSVGGRTGTFRLRTSSAPPAPAAGPCRPSAGASASGEGVVEDLEVTGSLGIGARQAGRLDASAGRYGGRPAQRWSLEGRAGQRLAIEQSSDELDSFVHLQGPGVTTPVYNDDDGESLNSRLCVLLPGTGTYDVVASAISADARGEYALSVIADPAEELCPEFIFALGLALAGLPLETPILAIGAEAAGVLDPDSDARHPRDGSVVDVWGVELSAGQSMVADIRSDQFDVFAYLTGPGIAPPLSDDDSAGRCDARLQLVAPESGVYRVVVNTFVAAGAGAYTVRIGAEAGPVTEGDCAASRSAAPTRSEANREEFTGAIDASRVLPMGVEMRGELDAADPVRAGGAALGSWALRLSAGDAVVLELASSDFDPILFLVPPEGAVLENDDGPFGTGSRLTFVAPADGVYHVIVSSYEPGSTGHYHVQALRDGPGST